MSRQTERDRHRLVLTIESAAASVVTVAAFAVTTLLTFPTLPWLMLLGALIVGHLVALGLK